MSISYLHIKTKSTLVADAARSGTLFLLVLAAYFFLHILIRISLSDSLDMDEAEAVLSFRQLKAGYGTQPPLYAWLQWLVFSVFGVNVFSLAALKNLLLLTSYLCLFCMARPILGVGGAMAVSASLILFPEIGWESHRDRTHSVLLTTMVCATLWCYFALLRRPVVLRYALFGALLGLGFLSKYNFAVFFLALVSASLLVAEHRKILWNWKVGVAAAVALLYLLPHGVWLIGHLDVATAGTVQKLQEDYRSDYLRNTMSGFSSMLASLLTATALPLLTYGVIYRRYRERAEVDRRSPDARFFGWFHLALLLLIAVLLLSGEISHMKARWIVPMLASLPLAIFVWVPALRQRAVYRRILTVAGCVALAVLAGVQLRVYLKPALGSYSAPHYPYSALSAELEQRFPAVRTLIVGDVRDAGNLYFQRSALRPLILPDLLKQRPPLEGSILLVMQEGKQAGWLEQYRAAYPVGTVRQRGRLELPYKYGRNDSMAFDYALIDTRGR